MTSATTGAPERSSSNDTPLTEHSSSASTDPNLKLHILVAEDDPINSQVVEKRLEKLGQAVKLTSNGEACFHAIASHEQLINIILMDIQVSFDSDKLYIND
ncbi:CheY-like superfamily [Penicillium argentinense]|uniref:CheY-like superfamily n=1 Tax=Penicillium argentinense TaxID=1131581 RepID=A0A9W9EJ89_9EURO|nr:CheY-like superfamily [Penicillium argentinense]KAJ5082793.1 CheY-like superfamily [Penicillium argentinense]